MPKLHFYHEFCTFDKTCFMEMLRKEFEDLKEEFKKMVYDPRIEDYEKQLIEYVYSSNKLEGNLLTLSATEELIKKHTTSTEARLRDILEVKGLEKGVKMMFTFAANKYPLSENIIKSLNGAILSPFTIVQDEYYFSWRESGFVPGNYKTYENKILLTNEKELTEIVPHSSVETVEKNMAILVERINALQDKNEVEKASILAYEIYINQPFPDGNKRTSRLLFNFMTMKEGLPFVIFNSSPKENFNSALIECYKQNSIEPLTKQCYKEINRTLFNIIDNTNRAKKGKGLSFVL